VSSTRLFLRTEARPISFFASCTKSFFQKFSHSFISSFLLVCFAMHTTYSSVLFKPTPTARCTPVPFYTHCPAATPVPFYTYCPAATPAPFYIHCPAATPVPFYIHCPAATPVPFYTHCPTTTPVPFYTHCPAATPTLRQICLFSAARCKSFSSL
jgi:hypothetical protein